jgi:hypothetical protein
MNRYLLGSSTFSSFTVETLLLPRAGNVGLGIVNVLGNNLAGLAAALLGFWLAGRFGCTRFSGGYHAGQSVSHHHLRRRG